MPTATPGTTATITFPAPVASPTGQRQPKGVARLAEAGRPRHSSRRTDRVLVLYYSMHGHIETLAHAMAEGARRGAGTDVTIKRVHDARRAGEA